MLFTRMKFTIYLLSSFGLLLFPLLSFADDYSNNVGFMKNQPKELKEKFPMCDQFLDVKWIRQFPNGGWVGTVISDVYKYDAYPSKSKRNIVVMQRNWPHPSYKNGRLLKSNLKQFDISGTKYSLSDIELIIYASDQAFSRHWDSESCTGEDGLAFKKGNEIKIIKPALAESSPILDNSGRPKRSYTQFTQNVCITFPDGLYSWVIENKRPFLVKDLMTDEENKKYEQFKRLAAKDCNNIVDEVYAGRRDALRICRILVSEESRFRDEGSHIRQTIILRDVDGDGIQDYVVESLHAIAFLNDKTPFFMPFPVTCNSFGHYDTQRDKAKEEQCVREFKKKYIQKNPGRTNTPLP